MNARRAGAALGALVALVLAWFVWPTAYRYHVADKLLVRENRFTGATAYYDPDDGWTPPRHAK